MNTKKLTTLVTGGLCASALAISIFAAPALAQLNNNNAYNANMPATTRAVERDDDFDWGWTGLLGLLGLAGLMKKPNREVVVQRDADPNVRRT